MVASFKTVDAMYRTVRKHVTDTQMEKIIDDLLMIKGSKSFRQTILRLAAKEKEETMATYKNDHGQKIDITRMTSGLFSIHRYNLRTGESVRLPGDYPAEQAEKITKWFLDAKEPLTWDKHWKPFINRTGRA